MKKYKDFRKSGRFVLSTGDELHGELVLSGGATSLDLYSPEFFSTQTSRDIFGTFHDLSKVSLLHCITTQGLGTGTRGDERYHFESVFPHFVLFGDEHISSDDRKVAEVSFAVDDAPTLFYDFDAFGTVIDARPHMERIAASQGGDRTIEIGDHPHLFYFTGKHDIFAVNTGIGKVSATHGISYRIPGPEGIHVQNTIRLNIAFPTAQTVEDAVNHLISVLRFMEVMAGRPQNIKELSFRLAVEVDERPKVMDAYWCLPPRRDEEADSRSPHPADLPLQAGRQPDVFGEVLASWLERHHDWRSARTRYATAMSYQHRYEIDRLVGAANMFDILPDSAFPPSVPVAAELVAARDAARASFKSLPPSPERDSVLGALGRIGEPALRHKIRSRAKLISDIVGGRFPDLELVTDQAVRCRNYFVHGSPGKFDYGTHTEQVSFFIDCLEFVFAASDLVESGWDIATWIKEGTTMSHPFGRFRVNYALQLAELKKLL